MNKFKKKKPIFTYLISDFTILKTEDDNLG